MLAFGSLSQRPADPENLTIEPSNNLLDALGTGTGRASDWSICY